VKTNARFAAASISAVWFCGSTGEMAIASTPFVRRSSITRCCSAAVPSAMILNSACTSASSSSAFSTPRRAMVQQSAELLVTNASLSVLVSPVALPPRDSHPAVLKASQATDAITPLCGRERDFCIRG
jgi:hypothetical protein